MLAEKVVALPFLKVELRYMDLKRSLIERVIGIPLENAS